MALIRTSKSVSEPVVPVMTFGPETADYMGNFTFAAGNTLTVSGASGAVTHLFHAITAGYDTFTIAGRSSQYTSGTVYGLKDDGTKDTLTGSNDVYDVRGYVAIIATLFPGATVTFTLS